jgi:hypothetical protein
VLDRQEVQQLEAVIHRAGEDLADELPLLAGSPRAVVASG